MEKMDKESKQYKIPEYKELFAAAACDSLSDSEYVTYSQSEEKYRSVLRALKEKEREGEENGEKKGEKKKAIDIARRLLASGMEVEQVAYFTELSLATVRDLKSC